MTAMTVMTNDTRRFDLREGRRKGSVGNKLAASRHSYLLRYARSLAVSIALERPDGGVTADDVYEQLIQRGIDVQLLGNAAGSLFRGKNWIFSGERRQSRRVSNHGRWIMVWQYCAPHSGT